MTAYAFLTALFGSNYTHASVWAAFCEENGLPHLVDFLCHAGARRFGGTADDFEELAEAAHGLLRYTAQTPEQRAAVEAARRARYAPPAPAPARDEGDLFAALLGE